MSENTSVFATQSTTNQQQWMASKSEAANGTSLQVSLTVLPSGGAFPRATPTGMGVVTTDSSGNGYFNDISAGATSVGSVAVSGTISGQTGVNLPSPMKITITLTYGTTDPGD